MAGNKSSVYIDLSFISSTGGEQDVGSEFTVSPPDNIGAVSVPIESFFTDKVDTDLNYLTELVFVPDTEYYDNILTEYRLSSTVISGEHNIHTSVDIGNTISGLYDVYNDFTSDYLKEVYRNIFCSVVGGNELEYTEAILSEVWFWPSFSGIQDYIINYTNFTGDYTTISGLPIPHKDFAFPINASINFNDTLVGNSNTLVSLFFQGWVRFPFVLDFFACDHSIINGPTIEYLSTPNGNVSPLYSDLLSSDCKTEYIISDLYCSLVDFAEIDSEVTVISGCVTDLNCEIKSTDVSCLGFINSDIKLHPIKISKLSIECDSYINSNDYFYVDVTDDTCKVSVSGTYMEINGVRVDTNISGIEDGYRLIFYINNNLDMFDGETEVHVHGENELGDFVDSYNYLTFGYMIEYINSPDGFGEYSYNSRVSVRVTAEDMMSCPSDCTYGYNFYTGDLASRDLSSSIVGRYFDKDGADDLAASIYPVSTAYFYGKEFEVVLTAKDFSGNEMEPFIFRYKIQDKPKN